MMNNPDGSLQSAIEQIEQIVEFTLDEQLYALPLQAVERVIHAVEITRLPGAPEIVPGIINVHGRIIPVVDIRKRFGLQAKEIDTADRIILADTGKRQVALPADSVTGMRDLLPRQHEPSAKTLPFAKHLKGVAKTDDGLILIYSLDKFLSLDEEQKLELAMKSKKR